MNVTFGRNINRCIKNFTRLPIVQMHAGNDSRFFIFDKNNTLIGAFKFDGNGLLSNLSLASSVQRKKTAADAILSIKEFIIQKAKDMKLKTIHFSIETPHNRKSPLRSLCRKFDLREIINEKAPYVLEYSRNFDPQKELETLSEITRKGLSVSA